MDGWGPGVDALLRAAVAAHRAGPLAAAEEHYRRVLAARPEHPDALHLFGLLLAQSNRAVEAVGFLRRAAGHLPARPDVLTNLGEAERLAGNPAAAADAGRRAVGLAPHLPEAHFNLGNALRDLGQPDEAVAAYRRSVGLRPGYAKAHFNLANVLREEGKTPVAVRHYRAALAVRPDWWEPLLNLGVTHLQLGETAAALDCLRRAQPLAPADAGVDAVLADAYLRQGRVQEAREQYRAAFARRPARWLARLRLDALAEPVPPTAASVDEYRAHLAETLDRFRGERLTLDPAELHTSGVEPPMALAYHGRDDRPLKEAYAALFEPLIAPLDPPPQAADRPCVGVVVTPGHEGVYDRCFGALADRLAARGRLRVRLVSTRAGVNVLRHLRPGFRGDYLTVPDRVDHAAFAIRAAGVDVLHFWEVGTDSLNYFLPFYRPARVVTAGWGWPSTTGTRRVDAFVSSALLEPADAGAHYTEPVARLPALPTCYERPPVPPVVSPRERFAIPPAARLYLCVQNLRKLRPEFDPVVADLLRADPGGLLVLLADEQPHITEQLLRRLQGTFPDAADRVRVVPRLPRAEYLGLTALADVVLDPPGYGGGANTAADAVAAAAPVVTWPGPFHRGRWQAAVNARLGVGELTVGSAADYVRTAVGVASDRHRRRALGERITAAAGALFADEAAAAAHEEFFLRAAE